MGNAPSFIRLISAPSHALTACALLLCAANSVAASVQAYIQPPRARPQEVVTYVITVRDGTPQGVPTLRLPLQIGQTTGHQVSQRIEIINGRRSMNVQFSWGIAAHEPGEFVIAPQEVIVNRERMMTNEVRFVVESGGTPTVDQADEKEPKMHHTETTFSPSEIHAAGRVALVVGNSAYTHGVPLTNPKNDAEAVAAALRAAGFDVKLITDAGHAVMEEKVIEFRRKAEGADAAWFYYAGHGVEVKGSNYLVPVDAEVKEEFQVKHKTLALDLVMGALDEAGTPLKVVVLDCCRDNPFGRSWSRSTVGGLGQVSSTPQGTIIAFAAAPGKTAADGRGSNSPYTAALLQALKRPGLDIDQVFKETGRLVLKATNRGQQPWINSSFYDRFVLVPGSGGTAAGRSEPGGMVSRPATSPGSPPPATAEPGGATREVPYRNGLGMTFVPVVNYTDGSKVLFCQHEARLSDYGAYASEEGGVDGEWKSPGFSQTGDHPVVKVSWDDAKAFCAWLTKTERAAGRIGPRDEYRLPRDHEWSLAVGIGEKEDARASPKEKDGKIETVYPWGGDYPPTGRDGNFRVSDEDGHERAAPVMSFSSNRFGLHDLGGNVWEWCEDWYDPAAPKYHVLRGGSWKINTETNLRSSCRRSGVLPYLVDTGVGFRCVLVMGGG